MNNSPETPDSKAPIYGDDFDAPLDLQRASDAARRLDTARTPDIAPVDTSELDASKEKRRKQAKRRGKAALFAAVIVIPVAGLAVITGIKAAPPTPSENTVSFTFEDNDGLYEAAQEVAGYETVDIRDVVDIIANMPENKEALADGAQVNETITIPEGVNGHTPEDK